MHRTHITSTLDNVPGSASVCAEIAKAKRLRTKLVAERAGRRMVGRLDQKLVQLNRLLDRALFKESPRGRWLLFQD